MDGIELEIVWSNLISIVSEQAQGAAAHRLQPRGARGGRSRQRAVRPPGPHGGAGRHRHARPHQLARGRGQALRRGLSGARRSMPGDVLITNDPWLSAGHFFDITVMLPVFHKDRLVGFFGSTIHHTDIGGYGVGAGARDVHEEGLVDSHAQALSSGASRTRSCMRSSGATCARRTTCSAISPRRCRAAGWPASGCRRCSTGMAMTTSSASPTR